MALPSAYGRDPFNELNRQLEAHHTTPGSIKRTCQAVEECLANNRDNLRGFFDKPFSNLLKRIFGYGDFEASWLNTVTKGRDADARALVDLLAPDGKLFAAMAQADSDHLVEYIFPTERLPAHTQELLKEPQGYGLRLLDTWPQYRGRIRRDPAGRPQVYLNLFEYFMFWTAFYVLRGSASDTSRNGPRVQPGSSSSPMAYGMNGLRMMGNLVMGRSVGALQGHPYYCLLKTYLEYFLPRTGAGASAGTADAAVASRSTGVASQSASTAGIGMGVGDLGYAFAIGDRINGNGNAVGWASYKPTLTAAAAGPASRGAILLSILVEFWLTDLTEPLPSAVGDRANGTGLHSSAASPIPGLGTAGSPIAPGNIAGTTSPVPVTVAMPPSVRMLTYQPPSEELVEGLVALMRYVHVIDQDTRQSGSGLGSGGRLSGGSGVSPSAVVTGAGMTMRSSGGSASRQPSGGGGGGSGGGVSGVPQVQLQPAQVGRQPWLPDTPIKTPPPPPQRLLVPPTVLLVHGSSATPAVQAVSRKVYRQLRRAFTQWPPSSPNSLTPLITLWLSILAPWCPPYAQMRKTESSAPSPGVTATVSGGPAGGGIEHAGVRHQHQSYHDRIGVLGTAAGVVEATVGRLHMGSNTGVRDVMYNYTPAWRGHVLAHLPFYLLLLPHFASLSLSRLNYRPDVALRDMDRVLAVLAAAGPELLRELRDAEAALNDLLRPATGGGRRRREGEYGEMAPWWLEQAHDFETAAASGSSSPGAVQPEVAGRLFATDVTGMAYTICLLLRNAETLGRPELVAALRQSASAVLPLESILPAAADQGQHGDGTEGVHAGGEARCFLKAARWSSHLSALVRQDPSLARPRRLWEHVYRGPKGQHDPMYRPIASNEIAFLARFLLACSEWLNAALGLDKPYQPGEELDDPPETLLHSLLLALRKKGFRFNLRFLAELQMLAWLLVLSVFGYFTLRPTVNMLLLISSALCPWNLLKTVCFYLLSVAGVVWGIIRFMPGIFVASRSAVVGNGSGGVIPSGSGSTPLGNVAYRSTAGGGSGRARDLYQRYNTYSGQPDPGEVLGSRYGGYRFRA